MPIRVVLADDDRGMRAVLEELIATDPDMEVVGAAEDADGAVELALAHLPDVVVLDVRMPGGGANAARRVLARAPGTSVVAFSAHEDDASLRQMIAAGARSYLVKGSPANEILAAIRGSVDGGATLSGAVAGQLVSELAARLGREEQEQGLRREADRRIRRILDEPELLSIAYQPIVALADGGRVVGLEALSRFPEGGDPSVWFRDAEMVGLGTELEHAAIARALRPLSEIPDDVYLAVNTSPGTLLAEGFTDVLADVPAGRVVVEVTEHAPIDDYVAVREHLDDLADLGIRLAVDDAGAGYASLRHILKLRPDVIKLDISLTRNLHQEPHQRALAAALVAFAHEIGATIVAEGVEQPEEVEALRELGVRFAQGYHFARPTTDLGELFPR